MEPDNTTSDTMLTSLRNPRVREVVRLRDRRHREQLGRFVVEGRRELTCAAEAGFPLRILFHCPDLPAGCDSSLIQRFTAAGVACAATNRNVFERMSYRRTPDGLLAVADTPALTLSAMTPAETGRVAGELWLVAAAIGVPGNLGAMLRSVNAVGASGLLVADCAVDVFNPNVMRASVGALFCTPIAVADGDSLRRWLEQRGVRVVLADPLGAHEYTQADLTGDVAIVVGSESAGLGEDWRRGRHEAVRLPMRGRVDSLNAATAAAVLLFEARRQRMAAAGLQLVAGVVAPSAASSSVEAAGNAAAPR